MLIPEIYVLWHPRCELGAPIAREIYRWLRPGNGFGPEVFYRSLPAPEAPQNGLPLRLRHEVRNAPNGPDEPENKHTNLQIIFPLIDENMVADLTWRHWLKQLAQTKSTPADRVMVPVALDATAYNAPEQIRELNYLRPAGLPPAPGVQLDARAFAAMIRSLLKQITKSMCRLLLQKPAVKGTASRSLPSELQPKVKVFLSHAKQDGTVPARRLRDYIYSQTQLAAFYDENDIAIGSNFSSVIKKNLNSPDMAAMIVVRSANYASRPWCRRELAVFRTPRQEGKSGDAAKRWRLSPSIVVEVMEGGKLSGGIPELGNSSSIRWFDDGTDLEELIVTTVIRDAMLASYHTAVGTWIPLKKNRLVINWLPDPATLLHIDKLRDKTDYEVVYPGQGLSYLELKVLEDLFPKVKFKCFEEILS